MTAGKFIATLVAHVALLCGTQGQVARAQDRSPRVYSTSFRADESPISEGGLWINGHAVGLDWKDVTTVSGLAFGADSSGDPHYDDPTAILSGVWGPDQTVQAKVHTVNQNSDHVYEEVEIRLRTTISPHRNSGYEISGVRTTALNTSRSFDGMVASETSHISGKSREEDLVCTTGMSSGPRLSVA
jgi:hypothetical protein